MGMFLLEIPDDLHDKLRHQSIDSKIDMQELIIDAIYKFLENGH